MTPAESPSGKSGDQLLLEARKILKAANGRGLELRLMGGVAVFALCSSARDDPLSRKYGDLDFFGKSKQSRSLMELCEELGYESQKRFNALHGHRRLLFKDSSGSHRDVLLDEFAMCHRVDLVARLDSSSDILCATDLLLTKLQVVEANPKDLTDIIALVVDCPEGSGPIELDFDLVADLCSSDWGLYRTLTMNCERVPAHAAEIGFSRAPVVAERMMRLHEKIAQAPKSRRWKMRARVGERVPWYETPDEVG